MTPPLLEISHLEAGYGAIQVLFGLSLRVDRGEFVTLLGRNGMGRSTTIGSIMGFLPVLGGSVRLDGRKLERRPPHEIARAGIGLVPEGRRIFPTLSVRENLVAFERSGRDGATAWTTRRVFGLFPRLRERKGQLAGTLSGGEQQMLAIGRALVTNPRLLILDEATEGLAPMVSQEIWASLSELKQGGLAIIATDKNLKPLLALGDRHYVLSKGREIWSGTSAEFERSRAALQPHLGV